MGGGTLTANGGRYYVEDFPVVISNKFKMNNTPLSWWGDGQVTLAGTPSSPAVTITEFANQPFTINRTAPTLITGVWSLKDSASGLNNSGVGATMGSGANVVYTGDIRENNAGNASGSANQGIYFTFNGAGAQLTIYGNNRYGDGATKGTSINVDKNAGYNSISIGGPGGPGAVITPLGLSTLYSNYGRGIFLKALESGQCITNNIRMDGSTDNDGAMPFGFDGVNDLTLGGTISPAKTVNFPNLAAATLTVTGGVNCGSVTLRFQGSGNTTFSPGSVLSGTSGGIGKTGPGTLTLAGTSTYLGSTPLSGGTAILDYSDVNASHLAPGTNTVSALTLSGVDLQLKGGSFAQTLGEGGGTTIAQGHSRVRRTAGGSSTIALGALTRATSAAGVVDFESGVASTTTGNTAGILGGYGFYTVDGTDWATGGGTITALASYDSFAVPGTDKNILQSGNGTLSVDTGINTLKLTSTGAGELSNVVSGYGGFNKIGSGTLLLSGANTYSGPTLVIEGTLKLGHDRGLGIASTNANRSVSPVSVLNGTTLDIAGRSAYIGNFTLANGTVADSVGGGVLGAYSFVVNTGLVSAALADVTVPNTGNLFNSINLFKRSAGTVTLTASNLYSGTTFVEAGDLVVNGTLAASPVIVQNAGTLRGTGTLARTLNVEGGTLAPGASASQPGTLTLGRHLRMDSGATLNIGVGGAASGKIVLSNPDAKVLLTNASLSLTSLPGAVTSLTIIDNQGANPVQGTFSGLSEGATFDAGGRRFAITYAGGDGNDVVLTFKPTATLILFN